MYTKGPWAIGLETDELEAQIINVEGMHVATVACDPVMDNARLIAAAPELLEALRLCECELSMYSMLASQSNNPQAWQDAIDAAREAIRKAKEK